MAKPRYPVTSGPAGSVLHNDDSHGFPDPNGGGGPNPTSNRIPPNRRGGTGHPGQRPTPRVGMGGGRGSSGNPASRGGTPVHMRPNTRVPGHGGSPQTRPGRNMPRNFGSSGQKNVPSYPHANPTPGAGNLAGRMAKRIAGNFTQKTKGKFGAPPVSLAT